MTNRGLSISEAAAALGASPGDVVEALRQGEFPGRFIVDGVMRLPSGDVESARSTWTGRRARERSSSGGVETSRDTLDSLGLRDLVSVLQEERRAWFNAIAAPLERHEERMLRVEDELRELRVDLKALGAGETHSEWEPVSATPESEVTPSDFGGLVREIAELEALLNDLDLD